jgi:hypothetical protein
MVTFPCSRLQFWRAHYPFAIAGNYALDKGSIGQFVVHLYGRLRVEKCWPELSVKTYCKRSTNRQSVRPSGATLLVGRLLDL